MKAKISRAQRGDLPRILAIQKEAYLAEAAIYHDFTLPPLRQSLAEIGLESESKVFLKAEVDGILVGSVRVVLSDRTCLIGRLIVDPKFQRRGIGSALLSAAESVFPEAVRFELFTGSRSEANIRLYERHRYVRFREEALTSALTLTYMQKSNRRTSGPTDPRDDTSVACPQSEARGR
jgi:ribosomal protein S18 acetylase RimI-like enzyme